MVNAASTSTVRGRPRAVTASYLTDTLPRALPPIFDQVQQTAANHRKNVVALKKIQDACSTVTEEVVKGGRTGVKLVGEKAFNTLFIDMLNRVLPVKKGVSVADRVVKFIASYVTYVTEQDTAQRPEDEEEVDTPGTRFIAKLLKHLLAGMNAKDKNVRFRVTLLTVSMINGLGEMDDDMYIALRKTLLDRSRDKEAAVRVQAALGLTKLQSGEDEDDLEEGEEPLKDVLLDLLRYDPAPEVRRAALYNLSRSPETLPYILARTRDVDPILRRIVYHGSLSSAALPDPRVLSIAQREGVVSNGLGDREASVRKATATMLGGWLDHAGNDLVEFLSRFDVLTSQVAEEALLSLFVTRPDVLDTIDLDDAFWNDLTPEKAFLSRVFGEHLRSIKDETRFDEAMPVVTALAFRTQDEYNKLVEASNDGPEGEADANSAIVDERAFIVGELLKLAMQLDYADETGRRKMFQLTREMISQSSLPESLIPQCVDVLTKISDGERDLLRVIVDVIMEIRFEEGDYDDPVASQMSTLDTPAPKRTQPPKPLDPEAKMRAALVDLRCLMICISALERVNSNLQDNSVFHGLLPDLIIPAVRNSEEPALRDHGVIALGLCCMIDSKMAANSFGLFVQQLSAADDQLKVKVAQILFDLLMVQDIQTLVSKTMPADKVVELVRHTLSQDSPEVQAVSCEGIAKLMLAGMISDVSTLQSLVLLYFSPETADNQPLRQCLTYFLPVYCYSSPENQRRMLSIFSDTFGILEQVAEEVDDDQEMLPLAQMGLMMVDWLDPTKTVERDGIQADMTVHLDLAIEILKYIMEESSKEIRKALVSFLSKLTLPEPEEVDDWRVKCVALLCASIRTKCPFADAASRNALNRFDASLLKKYKTELEEFDMDAFRGEENEKVKELFGFIDDVEERDADAASEVGSARQRRRRGRTSEAPSEMTEGITGITGLTGTTGSDDDAEGEEDVEEGPSVRRASRRTSTRKRSRSRSTMPAMDSVMEDNEDEDEGDEMGMDVTADDVDVGGDAGAMGHDSQVTEEDSEDEDVGVEEEEEEDADDDVESILDR